MTEPKTLLIAASCGTRHVVATSSSVTSRLPDPADVIDTIAATPKPTTSRIQREGARPSRPQSLSVLLSDGRACDRAGRPLAADETSALRSERELANVAAALPTSSVAPISGRSGSCQRVPIHHA